MGAEPVGRTPVGHTASERRGPARELRVLDRVGEDETTSPELPALTLPEMGPLTRAALFCDYLPSDLEGRDIDWESETQAIVDQRLAALAQRVIGDSALSPPGHIAERLQDAVFMWTEITCLASKKAAIDLEALRRANIDFVVTKGPGIAHYARRASERPYSDVDIFIPRTEFERTLSILGELGYAEEKRNILPWQSLNRLCREAVNLRSPSGGSLDVHHRIPPWFWGSRLTFSQVRRHTECTMVAGGGELPCASPADNLLISALHIVSDKNHPGSNLMAWRDFLLLAHSCDPGEVMRRARAARLCGWLRWILGALPDGARPPALVDALESEDPRIRGRRRLAMVIPPGFGSRHVVGQVFRLPVPNGALYLAGLAWPSSEFLDAKVDDPGHARSAWWRGGLLGLSDQARANGRSSPDPVAVASDR